MIVSYLIRRASDGLYMTPKGTRAAWGPLASARACPTRRAARSWATLWAMFGNAADRLEVWRMAYDAIGGPVVLAKEETA